MSEAHFPQEEAHGHRCADIRRPADRAVPLEPPSRSSDEGRAWSQVYAAVRDPSLAAEIVKQLNADSTSKQRHLALFIQASATLQKHKASQVQVQRTGALLRMVARTLVLGPFWLIRNLWRGFSAVAVEAMPPVPKEPAATRAPGLRSDPAFARARQTFDSEGNRNEGEAVGKEGSRGVKAA